MGPSRHDPGDNHLCAKERDPLWSLFDVVAAVVPIGLFFGRIANFINGELWGRLSSMPWAVVFPTGGPFARHPSQLYEAALEGIVLRRARLVRLSPQSPENARPRHRHLRLRLCCEPHFQEFFREPDAQIGYLAGDWLTMGMVLSLPMALVGIWAIARARSAAAAA